MKQSASIILADPAVEGAVDDPETPDVEIRAFVVSAAQHGQRLDRVLAEQAPEFSRSHLQQLIAAGAVRLAGATARKAALRLRAGDPGSVELRPTTQSLAFRPEPIEVDTVFVDEHLRIINKPAGLVVHPAPGHWSGTLLNGLLAADAQAARLPRAGIVHRLDKDTSGLMVVARTREAMEALVRSIAAREVRREYLALAHHGWSGTSRRLVEAPIGRDPRQRLRMAVVDLERSPGKPAATSITLLQDRRQGCLVRCTLQTGRTHQIRVHMASIGHPLVADALYGGAPAAGMSRQALHACELAFSHPASGAPMRFVAPPPPDLSAALAQWDIDVPQETL